MGASFSSVPLVINGTPLGDIAGDSVPATAPQAGDWYSVISDGTSQSITWPAGSRAYYQGTSGNWAKLTMEQFLTPASVATPTVAGPITLGGAGGSTALDAALPVGRRLSGLPEPWFAAHRGMSLVAPENSMLAYEIAFGLNQNYVLEIDVRRLRDGTLVIMHDDTVDRTCTTTGTTSDFNAVSWRNLVLDNTNQAVPDNLAPPTLADVFRRFGNRCVIMAEVKDNGVTTGEDMVQMALDMGISKDHFILTSFNTAPIAAAVAAGYPTLIWKTVTPASAAAAGATYFGFAKTEGTGYIATVEAEGLIPVVYSISTRAEAVTWEAAGIAGIVADDPYVCSGALSENPLLFDPWDTQGLYFGESYIAAPAGTVSYEAPDMFYVTNTGAGYRGIKCGWANALPTPECTIGLKMRYDSVTNTSRWGSLFIGTTESQFLSTNGSNTQYGYQIILRRTGELAIYKVAGTAAEVLLATVAGTSFLNGTEVEIEVEITASGITARRLDVPYECTTADTTYRPLIMPCVGTNGASVAFSDLVITTP